MNVKIVEWVYDRIIGCKRRYTIQARRRFFDLILERMSAPPDQVAILFGQHELYVPPAYDYLSEPEFGTLYIPIKATFHGLRCDHAWSIYQTGRRLRIAVILSGGLERAPLVDWKREMAGLWPDVEYKQIDREDLTLYEWCFQDDDLYGDFVSQEQYALNMRHCHARMLRIIHDYALMQQGQAAPAPRS